MENYKDISKRITDHLIASDKSFLYSHQISSFNHFISELIPNVVENYGPIKLYGNYNEDAQKYENLIEISFSNVTFHSPAHYNSNGVLRVLMPETAKLNNHNYSSDLHVDINIKTTQYSGKELIDTETENTTLKHILIGKLPIMVGSKYCNKTNSEEGGYFIINGSEKVIISQERQKENCPFAFNLSTSKYDKCVEIKSSNNKKLLPSKSFVLKRCKKTDIFGHDIHVNYSGLKKEIPLVILLKSLGISNDKEVMDYVLNGVDPNSQLGFMYSKFMESSITNYSEYNHVSAIEFMTKFVNIPFKRNSENNYDQKVKCVEYSLSVDCLPHQSDVMGKLKIIGVMLRKLALFSNGLIEEDDRDAFSNKSIDSPGIMLANLFRQSFTRMIKDSNVNINRETNSGSWKLTSNFHNIINKKNVYKFFKSSIIENSLRYSLATGNWGTKNSTVKVGVAQVLQRLSYLGTISHLRRIQTPIDKTTKMTKPRKLHLTNYGYICPLETPEGASTGIVKNLAFSSIITEKTSDDIVLKSISDFEERTLEDNTTDCDSIVFLNGQYVRNTCDLVGLSNFLKEKRLKGLIHIHTSLHVDFVFKTLNIYTSRGRLTRPLVRTANLSENLKKLKDCKNYADIALKTELIEYIDVNEIKNCMISTKFECDLENYTHVEINNWFTLGVVTGNLVFSNRNPAPRVTYAAAMSKQGLCVYNTNFNKRFDNVSNVLWYPQKNLIRTDMSLYTKTHDNPNGSNVIIAICADKGFNQEDSLIFNKSSIERGLFQSSFYRTYYVEEKSNQTTGNSEKFCKPLQNNTLNLRYCSYDALGENGIPIKGKFVNSGDAIFGKVAPVQNLKKVKTVQLFDKDYVDKSSYIKDNESGFVDDVLIGENADGFKFAKVKIRSDRVPIIGDKFASNSAQKGTIGCIFPESDMPYTQEGIKPDIIINPHALPSRMTFAQLLETLIGHECLDQMRFGDGTPFANIDVNDVINRLDEKGMDKFGESIIYSGEEGRKSRCFIGSCFYMRLKHCVEDKVHARSVGPVTQLTRQPLDGRSKAGGLRTGEMERDVMISHGVASFQKEKFNELSDKFDVHVNEDGFICVKNDKKNIVNSFTESQDSKIKKISIPFSLKLLTQEILSMGISIKLK